ncbi:MAG: NADH-quinone oxidoreductase subunit C [Candidatus Rehaiarchaeum fermentans]|nr:NADH-quinone oxidoreductase subunit C [Candidatus Rehaiarchaeum fermentans]MCW1292955.1 NADH-quinone oxidoreductase subunit C [Candidatus Rehaiarchaeum fermentans]MCW1297061.1 NADH-quinone oxidoreductase subunit C [Candidatus Rehaiarchaeum fermentans]MCW1302431.1 NADH-quinone oxidoreductase subunit C [Candidatus Rehaiarchaeum fermentans]MCW1311725.1 NADH-quinone oxidoreductase subunit C [Candidatus Rehaiarchaeum fermentans]
MINYKEIKSEELRKEAEELKDKYFLFSIIVVDRINEGKFELNYLFENKENADLINLKTFILRNDPKIDSISDIFPAADYEEREAYDMFGIIFTGHKNLKRILLPEDWPFGYPLRKDFVINDEIRNWTGTDLRW